MTTIQPPGKFSSTMRKDPQILIEEMACAIAEAQAALFSGRYRDLEICAGRMRELCEYLKTTNTNSSPGGNTVPGTPVSPAARRVQHDIKVFSAVLRRMRRHFEALRNVLSGPSLSYKPSMLTLPERKI
ncbi:MAG TPA: hypothetical protein VJ731_18030 [Terriglobales bacterium]|nr:hypothetical protein [Terriglobales bacterium]